MQLRTFAFFREIMGGSHIEWNQPAHTVGELLADLSKKYGKPFDKWMFEGDQLSHMVIILVNGVDIRSLQGVDTLIQPDDTISLFPPVAGGSLRTKVIR